MLLLLVLSAPFSQKGTRFSQNTLSAGASVRGVCRAFQHLLAISPTNPRQKGPLKAIYLLRHIYYYGYRRRFWQPLVKMAPKQSIWEDGEIQPRMRVISLGL